MIHSFSFSNLASFRKGADVSFVWNKNDSLDDSSVILESGNRVSKIMTLIGPNASGKSNLLRVLSFLQFFLVDAWQLPPDSPLEQFLIPFMLMEKPGRETKVSCVFETDKVYEISVTITNGFVTSEKVRIQTKTNSRWTWKTLYDRSKMNQDFRKNTTLLFTLERNGDKDSNSILNYWRSVFTNLPAARQAFVVNGILDPSVLNLHIANTSYLNRLNTLVKQFDLGFERVDIQQTEPNGYSVNILHKVHNKEYILPFLSKGTMGIINVSPLIFSALDTGGVMIYDELDASLHPEIVDAIIDLFASKIHNPKNAQLFFSTHNPRILNKLYKYQIQLVEKDIYGESETWRLDDMEGLRTGENYYAKYMT